ncbi:MAG TPA: SDR family oxidoreductase [Candidatus Omnitrophota bacterium]|nr:SDR family oxidoreductase [Candidatus Omnitrophota bacterium]HPD85576.1 SDR family oxidoreductase [Candidatus Omnitrophota bacterium]HRZ04384.1 SDR family oxidoreductase [Candidatus Omnitrophota bacterium]
MKKTVVIISITSDIGLALAKRYAKAGYQIVGTYRSTKLLPEFRGIKDCRLFFCDVGDKKSISRFIAGYKKLHLPWDVFISCPCNPLPLKDFFKCDFNEWSDSVHVNSIEQLRLLHQMYPLRKKNKVVDVVFLAGGGVNNAVLKFSAYTVSKIMLIKMCEFLDAEDKNINIFIVGPGWTRTKTHAFVLKHVGKDDERRQKVIEFLKKGKGTTMDEIYGCIRWLCGQGRKIAGGRNFSVVNDKWQGPASKKLSQALKKDPNMYKLRRCRNDFLM